MSFIQRLLADHKIHQLCLTALGDAHALDAALEAIYREGFAGTPQLDNAAAAFVQRLGAVRQEYTAQLSAFLADPERWEEKQLRLTGDPDALVCALTMLAGAVQAAQWEKTECVKLLDRRIAGRQATPEQNLALMRLFTQVPMSSLFAGGQVPGISRQMAPQFAGILAMCTYVAVKREPGQNIVPDLSFDTVCIWSNTMTDVLCVRDGAPAEAAATVGCVMAVQYAHISEWNILKACTGSICALSYPTMDSILGLMQNELLDRLENREGLYEPDWVWLESPEPGFSRWLGVLRKQQSEPSLRGADNAREEEEYIHSTESQRKEQY